MKEFQNYVGQTVAHYKDRVQYWQCFNEPLLTSYALPQRAGYKTADYIKYVEAFAEAARQANPQCKILAGFNLGTCRNPEVPVEFISLGGLKPIDIFTLHTYPGAEAAGMDRERPGAGGRGDERAKASTGRSGSRSSPTTPTTRRGSSRSTLSSASPAPGPAIISPTSGSRPSTRCGSP